MRRSNTDMHNNARYLNRLTRLHIMYYDPGFIHWILVIFSSIAIVQKIVNDSYFERTDLSLSQ